MPGRNFSFMHSPFKMIPTALSVHCFSTAPKTGNVAVNRTKSSAFKSSIKSGVGHD